MKWKIIILLLILICKIKVFSQEFYQTDRSSSTAGKGLWTENNPPLKQTGVPQPRVRDLRLRENDSHEIVDRKSN